MELELNMITQKQIKALIDEKGNPRKCPECDNGSIQGVDCHICEGTDKATMEIKKEWVECPNIVAELSYHIKCNTCKGKGEIQKYQVNEEIEICGICGKQNQEHSRFYDNHNFKGLKFKIISETENEQRVGLA